MKSINPLISIIVPIYNAEQYLSQCLNSIINQNYNDYEVILINDGSTAVSYTHLDVYKRQVLQLLWKLLIQKSKGIDEN